MKYLRHANKTTIIVSRAGQAILALGGYGIGKAAGEKGHDLVLLSMGV